MPPSDYIHTRTLSEQPSNTNYTSPYFSKVVDAHPYFPNLSAAASDETSVKKVAFVLIYSSLLLRYGVTDEAEHVSMLTEMLNNDNDQSSSTTILNQLSCTKVTGGITNALFRISGFQSLSLPSSTVATTTSITTDYDSVLVRLFGAEGMINRDIETSTYAALCDAGIAYRYMGRFQNGRIEGWLDGYHPLQNDDLSHEEISLEIAKEMARLHCLFQLPQGELRDHHCGTELDKITVGLWDQLSSWMEQARGYTDFKTEEDTERVGLLQLDKIEMEVTDIIQSFTSQDDAVASDGDKNNSSTASICFCHNDLLPANIMQNKATGHIQLIDFEYGGSNYAAFDMANHFNEYAGGTTEEENGVPDYTRFPDVERQTKFCVEYVKMMKRLESEVSDVTEDEDEDVIMDEARQLLSHVQKFILVNHLYWGLWAVNQAAEEGCEEFDYLTYASNRFNEYYIKKAELEEK